MTGQRRILILGAGGFVGGHLLRHLHQAFADDTTFVATGRIGGLDLVPLDVLDLPALSRTLAEVQPTHVINLAAIASPRAANADPLAAHRLHTLAPAEIGRILLQTAPAAWLVNIGTGTVYGRPLCPTAAFREDSPTHPVDIYGSTKLLGDLLLRDLCTQGLRAVLLRPFNHAGPGQDTSFALASFAQQIAAAEIGLRPPVIEVGTLTAERDYLDVRDVASAYGAVIAATDHLTPGTILNVASGTTRSLQALLDGLLAQSRLQIEVRVTEARRNPAEIPYLCGDSSALRRLTGWSPVIPTDQTLRDTLDYWRAQLVASRPDQPATSTPRTS